MWCLQLFFHLFFFLQFQPATCEQQILNSGPRHRNATVKDAEDIVRIVISAFSPLPSWKYIYQYDQDNSKRFRNCMQVACERLMMNPRLRAEVVEVPTAHGIAPVAVAMWTKDYPSSMGILSLMNEDCFRNIVNVTRAIDWERKFELAKIKYLDRVYGTEQLYLQTLATDRHYQGRGAGTLLVKSGLERARNEHLNTTLIAEPTAETFYPRVGFTSAANFSIESLDGDQSFRFNVMALPIGR